MSTGASAGPSSERWSLGGGMLPSNPHVRRGRIRGTEGHVEVWRDGSEAGSGAQPVRRPAELPCCRFGIAWLSAS